MFLWWLYYRSGALSAEQLEEDYSGDVHFLLAKLNMMEESGDVSEVIFIFTIYMSCGKRQF